MDSALASSHTNDWASMDSVTFRKDLQIITDKIDSGDAFTYEEDCVGGNLGAFTLRCKGVGKLLLQVEDLFHKEGVEFEGRYPDKIWSGMWAIKSEAPSMTLDLKNRSAEEVAVEVEEKLIPEVVKFYKFLCRRYAQQEKSMRPVERIGYFIEEKSRLERMVDAIKGSGEKKSRLQGKCIVKGRGEDDGSLDVEMDVNSSGTVEITISDVPAKDAISLLYLLRNSQSGDITDMLLETAKDLLKGDMPVDGPPVAARYFEEDGSSEKIGA